MTKQKLKPCPFCGGNAKLQYVRMAEDAEAAYVECRTCFARTDTLEDAYAPYDAAADIWNRRIRTERQEAA